MSHTEWPHPAARSYAELGLELRDLDVDQDSFMVSVTGPAVGELAPVRVPLRYGEIAEALQDLEDGGMDDEDDLIALGRALADRLLPDGPVRNAVIGAIRATGTDAGVRLRLLIREPRLAQIPWEYTYLSAFGRERTSDFLVLDPKVSLVRHEALAVPHRDLTPHHPGHLRLVTVTANAPGLPLLNLTSERRVVEQALKAVPPDGVTVDLLPVVQNPTVADLQAALVGGTDIFHFAGHGGLDAAGGYLALPSAGEGDAIDPLAADHLAKLLRQAGVRVAVLGACDSGRRDGISPWEGVAAALLGAEVAAVVAMQYRIRDMSAIQFARGLYSALAVGLSIDEAVTAGRLALFGAEDYSSPWGVPVLYSRSPDGVVFNEVSDRGSASADTLRTMVKQVVDTVERGGSVIGIRFRGAAAFGGLNISVTQRLGTVRGDVVGVDMRDGGANHRQERRVTPHPGRRTPKNGGR
jgi:hypothetical protein